MKAKIISSIMMDRIRGYLSALDAIDGAQNEYVTAATLISSNETLSYNINKFSPSKIIKDPKIICSFVKKDGFYVEAILKKLLLNKPFSGLYPPLERNKIPNDILEEYSAYIIPELCDMIEYAFADAGISIRNSSRDIELALIRSNKRYSIVLSIEKKSIKMLLFFYRNFFSEDDLLSLFHILKKL